ncbi:hypothetical protein [Natronolimnobius sp. AArcel1]|nr:hypothetical protein [Natronolimnobius sp. AArcel1]
MKGHTYSTATTSRRTGVADSEDDRGVVGAAGVTGTATVEVVIRG